jgi:small GTP-binding protein
MILTIGTCNKTELVKINNNVINMQLWDTAGQERFKSIIRNYYINADGIILLFDVTNKKSFDNLSKWLKEITDNTFNKKLIVYLVGNKIEQFEQRVVDRERGMGLANALGGLPYFEVSVKLNLNVREVVVNLVKDIYKYTIMRNKGSCKLEDSKIINNKKSCC